MLQGCSDFKDLKLPDGDDLCEGLNIDDVQLNFESGDEIFSCSQGQTRYQFEDVGTNRQLMEKNISVTESDGPIENALEVCLNLSFLQLFHLAFFFLLCISNYVFLIEYCVCFVHLAIICRDYNFCGPTFFCSLIPFGVLYNECKTFCYSSSLHTSHLAQNSM